MENIYNLMQVFNSTQYIVEFNVEKVKFIPYKVDILAQNLFNYCDHVLLMSATIVDVKNFAKTLGIKESDYEYVEVDSPFDSSKSPIVTFKDFPLNNKNLDDYMPKIVKLVNQILQTHHDEKGIVHTHTMKITNAIAQGCNSNGRLIARSETANNEKIVAEHIARKDASVLVSPSLTFGCDLADEKARFAIVIKSPFPSLGDTRVKKIFDENKDAYTDWMLVELLQACGRTTRNENDYSVTYIIDTNAMLSVVRNKNKLPKYFLDRFQ
jgi:Rad3-related DNA helicase